MLVVIFSATVLSHNINKQCSVFRTNARGNAESSGGTETSSNKKGKKVKLC